MLFLPPMYRLRTKPATVGGPCWPPCCAAAGRARAHPKRTPTVNLFINFPPEVRSADLPPVISIRCPPRQGLPRYNDASPVLAQGLACVAARAVPVPIRYGERQDPTLCTKRKGWATRSCPPAPFYQGISNSLPVVLRDSRSRWA